MRKLSKVRQSGVGLIEVLVAVLVLSVAFLGMAALQAMSLSTNNSAMARSMATISTYSILDAMRADAAAAEAGAYKAAFTADKCPASSTTLSSVHMNAWCTQMGVVLGAVATTKGSVTCTTTGDCTIKIQFDDSHAGKGGASDQTVVTRAML